VVKLTAAGVKLLTQRRGRAVAVTVTVESRLPTGKTVRRTARGTLTGR
jgi:hypothetical protein